MCVNAAAELRVALEPPADPTGEAGPVTATTNIDILAAQCADAGEDEHEHCGQRCNAAGCSVQDEQRKNRKHREQGESDG